MTDHLSPAPRAPIDLIERRQTIAQRKMVLMQRLDDGYLRIETAIYSDEDVTAWETFWIELLREYESLCESLERAA